MLINLGDLIELLRVFELRDLWRDARDAPEGSLLHRWRYVVQGIVLLILLPLVLALPILIVYLLGKS